MLIIIYDTVKVIQPSKSLESHRRELKQHECMKVYSRPFQKLNFDEDAKNPFSRRHKTSDVNVNIIVIELKIKRFLLQLNFLFRLCIGQMYRFHTTEEK